ncbi:MAG: RNA polymerase sigma factor RpoD/SigA [Candidatus Margulisbacteria bacterium]|jgi:RNA polymerase primary sigma factor|nr:RNA polymerase sigma factor RpoD/SigA [Candidatus Margulisiibacteriota bacterium]
MLCRKLIAENPRKPGHGKSLREVSGAQDDDLLSFYFKEIARYPRLTFKEEYTLGKTLSELQQKSQKLAGKIARHKNPRDILARETVEQEIERTCNKFAQANLRLVVNIAKKYSNRNIELLDLISEGNIGLLAAIKRFDYSKGHHFATYASWWIRQTILKALSDKGGSGGMRVPVNANHLLWSFQKARNELSVSLEREPTETELAEYLGWPLKRTHEHIRLLDRTYTSLDATTGYFQEDEGSSLKNLLPDEVHARPEETILEIDFRENIQKSLSKLTAREKDIIELYHGLNDRGRYTLKEIGEYFQLSKERVRQIKAKAFEKLRVREPVNRMRDYFDS